MKTLHTALLAMALLASQSTAALAQDFSYDPPGQLVPGSGQGRSDTRVYVPGMRFPIEAAPAYANSQVWGRGGSQGGGGGQCDAENFSYPWHDNYCESRQWTMPLCPSGTGHQGQDIRATTCENRRWWTVAAESGTISSIGTYSVTLMADGGTRHRYLHMDPGSLAVRQGQRVNRGDRLGLVSNAFGGTPTTIHLHYDLYQNVQGVGNVYVPTYMSLVRSYEELIGQEAVPCAEIGPGGATLDNSGPCFALFGPTTTWRHVTDQGQEGDLRWTYAWVSDDPGNWARWNLHFLQPGTYELAVNVLPEWAGSQQVPYKIRHAGQETPLSVNQAQGAGWVSLGRFDFSEGGDQWVSLYDNSGEDLDLQRRIMADALRITLIPPDPPDLGPEDLGPEDLGPEDLGPEDLGTPDAAPDLPEEDSGPQEDLNPNPADMGDPTTERDQGGTFDTGPQDPEKDTEPFQDMGEPADPTQKAASTYREGCSTTPGAPQLPWELLGLLALTLMRRREP